MILIKLILQVRHNIAYGDLTASDDKVFEAAKMAELHDVISNWPNGYQTQVKADSDMLCFMSAAAMEGCGVKNQRFFPFTAPQLHMSNAALVNER